MVAAPAPTNLSQLRSFIGLMNYYGKFVPNLSSVMSPLYQLLQKKIAWQWGKRQDAAFKQAKELLVSSDVLAHFNPDKELVLSCDASPYGIGAVLAQKEEDGTERPISYASRSLAAAEKRYSQLDKEGLAIVFVVKKFHSFLSSPLTRITSLYSTFLVPHSQCQHWHLLGYRGGPYCYRHTITGSSTNQERRFHMLMG